MNLAEFSVKNRVFVNLVFLFLFAGGLYSYVSNTKEVFPEVPLDLILITTVYPAVSPEEIEKILTVPIENAIWNIDGIERITSESVEGRSVVVAELEQGVKDIQKIVDDIRSEIDGIDDFPPGEAEKPIVMDLESVFPVINVDVAGDAPEEVLREMAEELRDRIERLEGVGTILINGLRDREIWVEVDPERLDGYGLAVTDVAEALAGANVNLPSGTLKGQTTEYSLRTEGEFETLDDVRDVVVRRDRFGRNVYVRDVASVRETFEEMSRYGRVNGRNSISLVVTKRKWGNTIRLSNQIRELAKEMSASAPDNVEILLTQDGSRWIKQRLRTLYNNGTIGFVLVCVILFLFLNPWMAFWAALGIPTSFLGAFCLMNLLGISINMVSLFALIVVLGMVVDDAIIVTENVYRYRLLGFPPVQAVVRGAREVTLPVVAATLTTVAAFLPMLMMVGIIGKFLSVIPVVVTIALLVSLAEAFLILPSHLMEFTDIRTRKKHKFRESRWFQRIRKAYRGLLKRCLKHRYLTVFGSILFSVGVVWFAYHHMKFVLFHARDLVAFTVNLETPEGTRLEETARVLSQVEGIAASLPEADLLAFTSLVGAQFDYSKGKSVLGSNLGQVLFELSEFETPGRRNGYRVRDEVREKLESIRGVKSVEVVEIQGGPPIGRAVELRFQGDDFRVLLGLAEEAKAYLRSLPGVRDVRDDFQPGKNEIRVKVDTQKAALYGLTRAEVASAVKIAFGGQEATDIRRGRDEIDVVVKLQERYRYDMDYIRNLRIRNPSGQLIPFENVADFVLKQTLSTINRVDRKRTVRVTADVDTEVSSSNEVNGLLERKFRGLPNRFPGYDYFLGGENEEQMKSIRSLLVSFGFAVLLIYIILATLFRSFSQPLVVMSAVPFACIGVLVGHYVMGQPITMLSLIGLVALTGIVVNDSLVMVDFINRARRRGGGRWLSVLRSGRSRFRPILLTSVTTIFGLATLAFKTTGQASFLAPMAISIVWGLTFTTILVLVVIPCAFSILDDFLLFLFGTTRSRSDREDYDRELAGMDSHPTP